MAHIDEVCLIYNYKVDKSRVGGDVRLLKSPLRLKPGPFVELKTCCTISIPLVILLR